MVSRARMTIRYVLLIISLTVYAAGIPPQRAAGSDLASDHAEDGMSEKSPFWNELSEGFDSSLRILSYGSYQDVADSTQNPGNDFLRLPTLAGDMEIRPDFYLQFRRLELSVKPRGYIKWATRENGASEEESEWENDWYVNEWRLRFGVTNSLFLSYGRENLQWGPSYLFSPSNPFFEDNGRMNTKMEVPGMDFATLVWAPSIRWSLSLIANMDEGHLDTMSREFRKSYTVKIDYTGSEAYTGLILSRNEKERDRIGVFGGWTATDALLLYADIGFSKGSDVLYPVEDDMSPFGVSMLAVDEDSSKWNGTVMVGASYTFLAGPTISMEYLYNEEGFSDKEAMSYNQLKRNARTAFYEYGPPGDLSRMTLGMTANPGMRFLRNNYAVLQYGQNDIRDTLNLSLSWIYNVDDKGGQLRSYLGYTVRDCLQIFSIGILNTGSADTEFKTFLDSYLMLGVEYTF